MKIDFNELHIIIQIIILIMCFSVISFVIVSLINNFNKGKLKKFHFGKFKIENENLEARKLKELELSNLLAEESYLNDKIDRIRNTEILSQQMIHIENKLKEISNELLDNMVKNFIPTNDKTEVEKEKEKTYFKKNYTNFTENLKMRCIINFREIHKEEEYKKITNDLKFNAYAEKKSLEELSFIRTFMDKLSPVDEENKILISCRKKFLSMLKYSIVNLLIETREIKKEKEKEIKKYQKKILDLRKTELENRNDEE